MKNNGNDSLNISIVSPVYNEAKTISTFVKRVDAVLKKLTDSYEILLINDGSSDETGSDAIKLKAQYKKLKVITFSKNRGQSIAISAGLKMSLGKYVFIMDSDLQHVPEEIPIFIDEILKGYDLVSGVRQKRKESFFLRKIPSSIANAFLRIATKCSAKDMGGFKCIRGDVARKIFIKSGYHRFLPALVCMMGGEISEVPIAAPKRKYGKSKYGISRMFDVFLDILMLWIETSFKSRPLYLFGRISLFLFTIASIIFGWLLFEKINFGFDVANRPPFFLSIVLYILSFLIFFQALILELLSAVFQKVINNDSFVVKEEMSELDFFKKELNKHPVKEKK